MQMSNDEPRESRQTTNVCKDSNHSSAERARSATDSRAPARVAVGCIGWMGIRKTKGGQMNKALMAVLVVSLVLNVIVAVGNWNLYVRVEKIETTLGLPAKLQSPQTPSQGRQR